MSLLLGLSGIPLLLALLSLLLSDLRKLRTYAAIGAVAQVLVTSVVSYTALKGGVELATTAWFKIDAMAAWFLVVNVLVYGASIVSASLTLEDPKDLHLGPRGARALFGLASLFIVAANGVVCASDLGALWVAVEATTVITAPLILLTGTRRSVEAAWKYIILCGVGLAFALFGTFFVHVAASHAGGTLSFHWLRANAFRLQPSLLDTGFIFFVLGYGTKAGLFPVHNWLPDAHSEAPAPASAILSGALLNVAMVALWRLGSIVEASHTGRLLMVILGPMGAITVLAASIMLIRQRNLKRMWAYSSIENMGILAIAAAFQVAPIFALHALAHSLAKAAAFLLSGNVIKGYGAVTLGKLKGLIRQTPPLGVALLLAGVASMGAPPFGSFVTEWMLLAKVVDAQGVGIAVALVTGLALSFVAVMIHLGRIAFGDQPEPPIKVKAVGSILPSVVLLVGSGVLFFLISPDVMRMLTEVLGAAAL